MSENLAEFLLEKRRDNEDEMETKLKEKFIGDWGEKFAYNYLKKLLEKNNIRNDIEPHKYSYDDYDLEIYVNGRSYKIEVKFSTKEDPVFYEIHFNNDFDFLLLIWKPSDDKIYFAILNKEEAKEISTPKNTNREYEDNWVIHRITIFDETNENFLKRLSAFLGINEELEDLEEEEKLYLIENAEEQVIKEHKDAERKDFSGETYQQWIYKYLSNYADELELMPRGYKYDIKYKGKGIEIKYSTLTNNNEFWFGAIKPDNFEFILFVGFDVKENKFYFEIESREEYIENKRERVGSDDISSRNGNAICVGKSFFRFGNDFTFEEFDNYIEIH